MNNHFFIVGAQRSGTTYLYNLLQKNEQICMAQPVKPEPKYFIENSNPKNLNQYIKKYFQHSTNKTSILGEKSTSYYELEKCAETISSLIPKAKIIFLLRNPTKRAISNYMFSRNNGLETRSIEDVFLNKIKPPKVKFESSVNPFDYLLRGEYLKHINTYEKYFTKKQIKIIIFEELIDNKAIVEDLYEFLNISKYKTQAMDDKINSSVLETNVPHEVIDFLNSYFKKSNQLLSHYLHKDLSIWN